MKRCKACTTRAAGAVECTLPAEHEGAHEGETVENAVKRRAVWNDPNAPYFEDIDLPAELEPKASLDAVRARGDELAADAMSRLTPADIKALEQRIELPRLSSIPPPQAPRATPTRCACGTEHTPVDRELRLVSGLPLAAVEPGSNDHDTRFSWARVCVGCGAVYCLLWAALPASFERSCTCPFAERRKPDFVHSVGCPVFAPNP